MSFLPEHYTAAPRQCFYHTVTYLNTVDAGNAALMVVPGSAELSRSIVATLSEVEQSVYAEMYAYGNLSQTVDLNTTEMMSYIWWSGQEDIVTKGKEFLVGLDPSAVIRNRGAGTS